VVFDGETLLTIATPQVQPIDTVGAGDMYAGGFLYGITHGMGYQKAAELGSIAASKVVTSYGPRLETEVLKNLLAEIQA
jgi:sugar/nucleoside kinase (ribokinase family)